MFKGNKRVKGQCYKRVQLCKVDSCIKGTVVTCQIFDWVKL